MANMAKNRIRDLRDGDWYWIQKKVIREYPKKVGATGILVYNFLASLADSRQSCFPSQKYIAKCLGYSRATVNKAIKALEKNGLIKIKRRGRYYCIYSLVEPRCKVGETQMSNRKNSDVKYTDTNNNNITRININNNVSKDFLNFSSKGFSPKTKEKLLALDVADELNDRKNLSLYLHYARCYPESLLRRVLGEVKETPFERIKKSKAALFCYLVKKYAEDKCAG